MSFVKTAKDLSALRQAMKKLAGKTVPIVSKIETPEAVKNIDEIIKISDVVMVARGDLALNIPQGKEAVAQKQIVTKCVASGTPVIMATQMLDSMIHNPRPTRAEISDVANAVIDHVDCVMLSGESAFGQYPLKAVQTMSEIITETEKSQFDDYVHSEKFDQKKLLMAVDKFVHAVVKAHLRAIVVSNYELAQKISRFRPETKIIFASKNAPALRLATVLWGVVPVFASSNITKVIKDLGMLKSGQKYLSVVNTSKGASVRTMA
jgi:pyruvate kinase